MSELFVLLNMNFK